MFKMILGGHKYQMFFSLLIKHQTHMIIKNVLISYHHFLDQDQNETNIFFAL